MLIPELDQIWVATRGLGSNDVVIDALDLATETIVPAPYVAGLSPDAGIGKINATFKRKAIALV